MIDYSFVYEKAQQARIDETAILREYWQLLFLQKLYVEKASKDLFFKGGTAIRFLLNSFRFSEDLDFTSILSQDEVEKTLARVFSFFEKNASEKIAFKKEKVFEKFAKNSIRYKFLFLPKNSKQFLSIKIDVSFREKPLSKDETVISSFDYPLSPYPLVVHLSFEEIFAEKIRALLTRTKPRDLFDVWFLLTKKVNLNEKMINKKLGFYKNLNLKFNKKLIIKRVESYDEKEIKRDLNQFLPEEYRNFFAKLKGLTIDEMKKI